jgi:hypothetical protein
MKKGKHVTVDGESDLDSEDEEAVAEAQRALGIRPKVELDEVYREVMAPLPESGDGVRYWPH